jgi:hypothetical protein
MHGFLSNVTAALLALHTVLGCCWHHAHSLAEESCMTQSVERPEGHGGHSDHDCDSTTPVNHDGHQSPHECQGSTCVFVRPTHDGSQGSSDLLMDVPLSLSPIAFASTNVRVAEKSFFAPDALLPPLRLHLVDQVLLI